VAGPLDARLFQPRRERLRALPPFVRLGEAARAGQTDAMSDPTISAEAPLSLDMRRVRDDTEPIRQAGFASAVPDPFSCEQARGRTSLWSAPNRSS
jgi:hypothetical protein